MKVPVIQNSQRRVIEKEILTRLGKSLLKFGFDPKVSGQSFRRPLAREMWAFHVSFIPHQTDLDLTADVAIRIQAIEDLVNQYDTKPSPAEKRQSMTLGGEIGNISLGRQLRWTVADPDDLDHVCQDVINAFERTGLPFLKGHSDIGVVHRVLTSSDSKETLLCPILGPRAMRAVASATYLSKRTNFPGSRSGLRTGWLKRTICIWKTFVLCRRRFWPDTPDIHKICSAASDLVTDVVIERNSCVRK